MKETLRINQTDNSMTTFDTKHRTRIGTWNIRTLLEPSRIAQLTREISQYNIDIVGISEVRWPEQGEFVTNDGYSLLYSGKAGNETREYGVGILLSKKARKSLLQWEAIDERIIWARFYTPYRKITFVQCYAPTDTSSQDDKEHFYDKLNNTMRKIGKGDILVVMGDFNAKVGTDNQHLEDIMGKHGLGIKSDNGNYFTQFCQNHDLVIGGTIFPHRQIHKVTWVSPDGQTKNQIDHITISKKWRRSLLDVRNRRGADMASDHFLVVGEIRLKLAAAKTHVRPSSRKAFNLEKLKSPPILKEYRRRIQQELDSIPPCNEISSVEKVWSSTSTAILNTAEDLLGIRKSSRSEWISDQTWNLIGERKALKLSLLNEQLPASKENLSKLYTVKNKQVKRSARKDKRKWIDSLAEMAEEAVHSKNVRKLYSITRKLSNKHLSSNVPIKNKAGKILSAEADQLARWAEHFSSILSEPYDNDINLEGTPFRTIRMNTEPPTVTEIQGAINKLKCHKAPGIDNIAAELLQADAPLFASKLRPLLLTLWNNERIPDTWKEGLIIKLPKKGNLQLCQNWRGITLLNTIIKVMSRIVLSRIEDKLEQKLRREQAGFRPGRSCIDHINTLRIIVEQSIEWQTSLYVCFIDFKQAFDRVNQKALWQVLSLIGVPAKLVNLIKNLYLNSSAQVLHNGKTSKKLNIVNGVKQGCLLSPILFNTLLDWVLKKALIGQHGIQWGLNTRLEDLTYADDICLLAHTYEDMLIKLQRIISIANQVGLTINIGKTKIMRVGTTNTTKFYINNEELEEVQEFCYLGSVISNTGGTLEDIQSRISKAQRSFGMLNEVWRSSKFSNRTKLRIFNSNVKAILLYGCETWKTTAQSTHKLQVFINRCLRRIMRVNWFDRISNDELWHMTNQKPVSMEIRTRKWNWIGHTLRKDPQEIAKIALDWNPQGNRRRGRPNTTWRRATLKELETHGSSWKQIKRLASNRARWREFVRALCSPEEP